MKIEILSTKEVNPKDFLYYRFKCPNRPSIDGTETHAMTQLEPGTIIGNQDADTKEWIRFMVTEDWEDGCMVCVETH